MENLKNEEEEEKNNPTSNQNEKTKLTKKYATIIYNFFIENVPE